MTRIIHAIISSKTEWKDMDAMHCRIQQPRESCKLRTHYMCSPESQVLWKRTFPGGPGISCTWRWQSGQDLARSMDIQWRYLTANNTKKEHLHVPRNSWIQIRACGMMSNWCQKCSGRKMCSTSWRHQQTQDARTLWLGILIGEVCLRWNRHTMYWMMR